MKPPGILRAASRSIALPKTYHRPKIAQLAALGARQFSATTQRPFLDTCLVETHSLISGLHDMTGLPWAATIPLLAFIIRFSIMLPINNYCMKVIKKTWILYPRRDETRIAIERSVRQKHGDKSPQVRERIQKKQFYLAWRQVLKENGALIWTTRIVLITVPIWFTIMETIRRMTGTEDGMLSLVGKSLVVLKGEENSELSSTNDVIPTEPSLATEGMLWFDNLMIPDPTYILPFAVSGIMFTMYSLRRGSYVRIAPPWATLDFANRLKTSELGNIRIKKIGSLAIGPLTLMFPSAMLLYWFSSTLAAIILAARHELWRMLLQIVRNRPEETKPPHESKQEPKPRVEKYYPQTMKEARRAKLKKK